MLWSGAGGPRPGSRSAPVGGRQVHLPCRRRCGDARGRARDSAPAPPRARAARPAQPRTRSGPWSSEGGCFPLRGHSARPHGGAMVPGPGEPSSPAGWLSGPHTPFQMPLPRQLGLYRQGTPPGQAVLTQPSGRRRVGPGEQQHWDVSTACPRPSL